MRLFVYVIFFCLVTGEEFPRVVMRVDRNKRSRPRPQLTANNSSINEYKPAEKTKNTVLVSDSHKYRTLRKIGSGSTSIVYEAKSNENRTVVIKQVAINTHSQSQVATQNKNDNINMEKHIYDKLNKFKDSNKISCSMYDYFTNQDFEYFVLEKLGVSLQHLLFGQNDHKSKFDLNTVCTLVDFMIVNLYKLHSIGFVHNDLKLENILIGTNSSKTLEKFYLIDFGISSQYYDFAKNEHIPLRRDVGFKGTFRFSSQNHHCYNLGPSRRDDLESLIYLCIYCLTNDLPWIIEYNGDKKSTKQQMFKESQTIKEASSVAVICKDVPNQFDIALNYIRNLEYNEMPDYRYLQNLFQQLHSTIMVVSIDWDIYNFGNRSHFLGSHTIHQNNNDTEHKEFEIEATNDKNDKSANANVVRNNIKDQNSAIIEKFNAQVDKPNATLTNPMLQTQLTVCNNEIKLKNRFGYVIDRLVIKQGVPKSESIECDYGGIIIYETTDEKTIYGEIYMLDVSTCKTTNKTYYKKYNKKLNGKIHGAVYYCYFGQNIHTCDEAEAFH